MTARPRSPLVRYGVALGVATVAAVLAVALERTFDPHVPDLLLAGVVVAAWYGGFGPGLLAAATALGLHAAGLAVTGGALPPRTLASRTSS